MVGHSSALMHLATLAVDNGRTPHPARATGRLLLRREVATQEEKHRSAIARSEKYAHTEDIVHILQELDKDELPCFVIDSMGLTKLPKINAESFCYKDKIR